MVFESVIGTEGLTLTSLLWCTLASLGVGLILGLVYYFTERKRSKGLLVTVIMLPLAVQIVIMMVNGDMGAGLAVAGAFALVRFRSTPGTAKEICIIFCVMACGLATGMGFILFAFLMAAILAAVFIVLRFLPITNDSGDEKIIRILMPENLDYDEALKDVFARYTKRAELVRVKTMELGSLYQLTYSVKLKAGVREKEIIDELRIRNGNLTVNCFKADLDGEKL